MTPLFIARFRTDNRQQDDQRTVHVNLNVSTFVGANEVAGAIAKTLNRLPGEDYWVFSVIEPIAGVYGYGDDLVSIARRVSQGHRG